MDPLTPAQIQTINARLAEEPPPDYTLAGNPSGWCRPPPANRLWRTDIRVAALGNCWALQRHFNVYPFAQYRMPQRFTLFVADLGRLTDRLWMP